MKRPCSKYGKPIAVGRSCADCEAMRKKSPGRRIGGRRGIRRSR